MRAQVIKKYWFLATTSNFKILVSSLTNVIEIEKKLNIKTEQNIKKIKPLKPFIHMPFRVVQFGPY